jgi:hypothetical protein
MKWLFLVHQVQTPNSRERVKVWRAIKKTGAVLHRNSVYVLPYNKERLEDFQWVCQQIRDSKGEASIFVSEAPDKEEDTLLRGLFQRARQEEYSSLLLSAQRLMNRVRSAQKQKRMTQSLMKSFLKEETALLENLEDIHRVDFFSNALRGKVSRVFKELKTHLASAQPFTTRPPAKYDKENFQKKVWATRERIHIDRLCSAWLIWRFIDPQASFVFAPENKLPKDAIAFDVLGAEFSHHDENCTFETLAKSFQIQDPAIRTIGEMIHDVDLKDHKFGRPEGPGLDAIIRSLSASAADDHEALRKGSIFLDALYKYYSKSASRK